MTSATAYERITVKGQWKYFYRAVDKQGNTIDFLLTAKRDKKTVLRFLNKAISRNGKPGRINIDKSDANTATIKGYNNDHDKRIKIRQCKYLNNIFEQDHRRIKRQCLYPEVAARLLEETLSIHILAYHDSLQAHIFIQLIHSNS